MIDPAEIEHTHHQLRLEVLRGTVDGTRVLRTVLHMREYVVSRAGTIHHVGDNGRPACGRHSYLTLVWGDLDWSLQMCRACRRIDREGWQ